jgi:uncharacterized OB-fold protein
VPSPTVTDRSVFAEVSPPRLAGARCAVCGTTAFPQRPGCPRCGGETDAVTLPDRGTVWTWTVQCFSPKPPYRPPAAGFAPYAVGYVDLGEVLVASWLAVPPDLLRVGLPVRLTLVPAYQDEHGAETLTYAFTSDTGTPGTAEHGSAAASERLP